MSQTISIQSVGTIILSTDKETVTSYTSKDVNTFVSSNEVQSPVGQKYSIEISLESTHIGDVDYFVFEEDDVAYIHWISVNENYQQQGIGTAVIEHIISTLTVEKVYTHPVSVGAISLFDAVQFTKDESINSGLNSWYSRQLKQ